MVISDTSLNTIFSYILQEKVLICTISVLGVYNFIRFYGKDYVDEKFRSPYLISNFLVSLPPTPKCKIESILYTDLYFDKKSKSLSSIYLYFLFI